MNYKGYQITYNSFTGCWYILPDRTMGFVSDTEAIEYIEEVLLASSQK